MNGSRFLFHSQDVYNETASPEGPPSAPPTGGSAGGARVVTPDSPFSVEDMTSDSIFYVQDGRLKAPASRDAFSFYISDGHSQTEAVSVEIDIQVGVAAVLLGLQDQPASLPAQAFPPSLQSKDRQPVVSVSSIHVEENSGVVITNSSLRVLDYDAPENEIILTVIRKPSYGESARLKRAHIVSSLQPNTGAEKEVPQIMK